MGLGSIDFFDFNYVAGLSYSFNGRSFIIGATFSESLYNYRGFWVCFISVIPNFKVPEIGELNLPATDENHTFLDRIILISMYNKTINYGKYKEKAKR